MNRLLLPNGTGNQFLKGLGILFLTCVLCSPAAAELVGQWTFEDNEELIDKAGNFPDLLLMDDAEVVDGALKVTGNGTASTGWAITDSNSGDYTGPDITSKTLVAWVTMEGLEDVAKAGSVITIDRISNDTFDGIIFAEREFNRWMNGSSGFQRTMDFDPGFEEDTTGELIQLAISYEDLGDGFMTITGYRNGEEIGQYEDEPASSWDSGDAEIIFGKRHGSIAGGPGALEALIEEARIYDEVLTGAQIVALNPDESLDDDGDGLSDDWERENFGNLDQPADGDPDGDGSENLDELKRKTDPNDDDSDDDTLKDGVETKTGTFVDATNTGTDPLDKDSDDDGLDDNVETGTGIFVDENNTGTDPNDNDSDDDRINDGAEVAANTDPNDPGDPPKDPIESNLVGRWTFESGEELVDVIGNFPDLELMDDAEIKDGKLVLTGEGTTALGWAVTAGGDYSGPLIESKTLTSWATIDSIDDLRQAGSLITIDRISGDHFDGIIFAEREDLRWMSGSSGFSRTQDADPGFEEERAGELIFMAITYEYTDDDFLEITLFRNGEEIGQYESANLSSWDEGDAEIFFGKRHGSTGGGPGAINASIDESSIYDVALTPAQITELFNRGPNFSGSIIGHWTFEVGEELKDRTGNFPDLELMGSAKVENGRLDVSPGDWAVTVGDYEGPAIEDKTLMAWITMEDLAVTAGSAITIDRTSGDHFDGIIYAERQPMRWMNGSSGFQRTEDFVPGFAETETGKLIHLAISYENTEDGLQVSGYRNGELLGQYVKGASNWDEGDAEVFFGIRHGSVAGGPGALDALIEEARIYSEALAVDTINQIVSRGPLVAADGDGDGLQDSWELVNFGNLDQPATGDPDGDNSTNINEQTNGTDPNDADSDDDGLTDGVETKTGRFVSATDTGTDPLSGDSDGDGLSDGVETGTGIFVDNTNTGTDPNKQDSDGDRIADNQEIADGTNPTDPNSPPRPPFHPGFLVGHWTFDNGEELTDLTGNFPELLLQEDATIEDGVLDVSGDGTTATGWAVTDSDSGEYQGPDIENKTLVSWLTLESLSDTTLAGSAITIDRISGDHFDGIIFAEREPDRWMNGSSGFQRTQNFDPGFEETEVGEEIMMAITYENLENGQLRITGYRNAEEIGQYEIGNASNWQTGDAEIFFGKRHGNTGGGPGALDALINEARIYNETATRADIEDLFNSGPGGSRVPFQITNIVRNADGSVAVTWTSRIGATFIVETAEDLQLWTEVTDGFPAGGATEESTTLTLEGIPSTLLQLYVRVREEN